MNLSRHATIAKSKLSDYLLRWRPENDKSGFLAKAGYTQRDADCLERDIREQLLSHDAKFESNTEYGDVFSVTGSLTGPNGNRISVISIWMVESTTGETKFITLYPAKEY